jgi:hypothetical protein
MFKHPLISYYILNVFAKLPIHPMNTRMSVLETMCYRIIVSVYQRRISTRYINGDAQFSSIEMEIADSGREGTCVASITVTAEPKDWQGATRAAVQARVAPAAQLTQTTTVVDSWTREGPESCIRRELCAKQSMSALAQPGQLARSRSRLVSLP